jgi:hypothetical protein
VVKKMLSRPEVIKIQAHQCMLGLTSPPPENLPMKKATGFARGSCGPNNLISCLNRRCDETHTHVKIEGSIGGHKRSHWARIWGDKLVKELVAGIYEDWLEARDAPVLYNEALEDARTPSGRSSGQPTARTPSELR